MNRRTLMMLIALIASLAAAYWASGLEDVQDSAALTPHKPRGGLSARVRQANSQQDRLLMQLARGTTARPSLSPLGHDPFAITSFAPPSPPVAAQVMAPTAPPLPFKYRGLLQEESRLAVFLEEGGQMLIAHEGETLLGQYKVNLISTTEMRFEYMPMSIQQTLSFE